MNELYYNGFASEEQYEAVKKAITKAIVNCNVLSEFEVDCYDYDTIRVDADGLTFSIYNDSIYDIECNYSMGMFEVDLVQEVYENLDKIIETFNAYKDKVDNVEL